MIPSHDLSVWSGNGWTIVETAGIQETPERDWSTTADSSLAGVVNVGSDLAKALVIAR
jgi:hypothetical protein